jgi:ATP-dependent Clp protease ATP-binding subunit ClpA
MTTPYRPAILDAYTDEVKGSYTLAEREAHRLGHPLIESDHLVLGIIAQRNNMAADALTRHGLGYSRLQALSEQAGSLVEHRNCFDGHDIDDTRPSLEVLNILQLARLLVVRENPAAADRRLGTPRHLLQAILLTRTENPQMQRLLYAQGKADRKVRPGVKLLLKNGVDVESLYKEIAAEPHSWF